MKTTKNKCQNIEWLSAEEMHEDSVQWMSELKFVKGEQQFLNNLVKSYTLQLIDPEVFDKSKKIIDAISSAEKEVVKLMKAVQVHENQLEIMVDDLDELEMEKTYRNAHCKLRSDIDRYLGQYRKLKTGLFRMLSKVMKKQKQKRLLN